MKVVYKYQIKMGYVTVPKKRQFLRTDNVLYCSYVWCLVDSYDTDTETIPAAHLTFSRGAVRAAFPEVIKTVQLSFLESQSIYADMITRVYVDEGLLLADVTTEERRQRTIILRKTGQFMDDKEDLFYLGFCPIFIGEELGLYAFEKL